MHSITIQHRQTRMVAHRGLSGIEKENTCAAFVAAGNRSYYGIETDVHRTLDGKFVCIHDDTTGRVAIDQMTVEQTTFDTLRGLILCDTDGQKGRSDLRIPTLQEYVQLCKKYNKIGVLELKNAFDPDDIARIIDIIRAEDYLDHITFISFSLENLLSLRTLLPQQPCQYLVGEITEELLALLCRQQMDLDVYYPALTETWVHRLHEKGIRINCWTCDDPEAAERLVSWGVDYITSNILE